MIVHAQTYTSAAHGALAIVVDDDSTMCTVVAETLRGAGYYVLESDSGEAALRSLEETVRRPALVVSDIDLGTGMNGVQFAAAVHARWPHTGVLLMSGRPLPREGEGEAFLPKPLTITRLLDRVASLGCPHAAPAH